MLKTAMFVSALALSASAYAQDQKTPGREPMTTLSAQSTAKKAPPAGEAKDVDAPTEVQAPTTAAQGAPISGAPVSEAAPAEQAAMPAPQTAPATPPTAPAETAAATAAPADPAAASAPTEVAAAPAAPAAPAEAKPAVTGATQIAQVVTTEFPTYDKNKDTNLDRSEFASWMVALKTASDPTTKAADPATVKWIDGAFASADADKSKSVSQAELTKYLSQGAE